MFIAIAALLKGSIALKAQGAPDVYGPNGEDYSNNDPRYDLSLIRIDVTE